MRMLYWLADGSLNPTTRTLHGAWHWDANEACAHGVVAAAPRLGSICPVEMRQQHRLQHHVQHEADSRRACHLPPGLVSSLWGANWFSLALALTHSALKLHTHCAHTLKGKRPAHTHTHTQVVEFDEFLIDKVTPVVNKVVTIVNELNGCVDSIKDAAAVVQGAFKVDVETGKERDAIILALQKADGTWPSAAEVTALDASAVAADKAFTKARKALEKQTEASYAKLDVVEDKLSSESPPAGLEG
jgi:hypothetical protein